MSKQEGPGLLAHGVAGAASSVLSLALLYPLDQLRTLQQVKNASAPHKKRLLPEHLLTASTLSLGASLRLL